MAAKKKTPSKYLQRRLRVQQIILIIIGVLVILSMVISLVTQF